MMGCIVDCFFSFFLFGVVGGVADVGLKCVVLVPLGNWLLLLLSWDMRNHVCITVWIKTVSIATVCMCTTETFLSTRLCGKAGCLWCWCDPFCVVYFNSFFVNYCYGEWGQLSGRVTDSWLKDVFESWQEIFFSWVNFLCRLFISVSIPPQCYHSGT